jgi:UDP:flavonoid glycosyltransferase YjiC (YdhE family)
LRGVLAVGIHLQARDPAVAQEEGAALPLSASIPLPRARPRSRVTARQRSSSSSVTSSGSMREMPPGVLMVGAATWDPPEPLPDSIPDDDRPLVLVACSSEFQDDAAIAAAAIEGLAGDHRVVVTTAGVDPADLPRRGDAAVERHLRHSPLLERASVLVCHGGMGGTQKALAMGVPVCVVPWARDQLDGGAARVRASYEATGGSVTAADALERLVREPAAA